MLHVPMPQCKKTVVQVLAHHEGHIFGQNGLDFWNLWVKLPLENICLIIYVVGIFPRDKSKCPNAVQAVSCTFPVAVLGII